MREASYLWTPVEADFNSLVDGSQYVEKGKRLASYTFTHASKAECLKRHTPSALAFIRGLLKHAPHGSCPRPDHVCSNDIDGHGHNRSTTHDQVSDQQCTIVQVPSQGSTRRSLPPYPWRKVVASNQSAKVQWYSHLLKCESHYS